MTFRFNSPPRSSSSARGQNKVSAQRSRRRGVRIKFLHSAADVPDWEYELKLDGYGLQAIKDGEKVRLLSRRGNDFTRKFAKIATTVSKIKATSVILGGEAVEKSVSQ